MIGNAYSACFSIVLAAFLECLVGVWEGKTALIVASMAILQYGLFRFWVWRDHRKELIYRGKNFTAQGDRLIVAMTRQVLEDNNYE